MRPFAKYLPYLWQLLYLEMKIFLFFYLEVGEKGLKYIGSNYENQKTFYPSIFLDFLKQICIKKKIEKFGQCVCFLWNGRISAPLAAIFPLSASPSNNRPPQVHFQNKIRVKFDNINTLFSYSIILNMGRMKWQVKFAKSVRYVNKCISWCESL